MKQISADQNTIAYCGLYCGACKRFLAEKCPGCQKNEKAPWCKVRQCCMENNYLSCTDCKLVDDPSDCRKFNNFMSKFFGFIFRSNRRACIDLISEKGYPKYAEFMAEQKRMSLKR